MAGGTLQAQDEDRMGFIKYPDGKASETECHDGIYTRNKGSRTGQGLMGLPSSPYYLIIEDYARMDKLLKQCHCNYESNAKHLQMVSIPAREF